MAKTTKTTKPRIQPVAQTPDRTIRVYEYADGSVRVAIVKGTRYLVKGMFFGPRGGNITLAREKA
jgi:hypothetical protein